MLKKDEDEKTDEVEKDKNKMDDDEDKDKKHYDPSGLNIVVHHFNIN